MNVLKALALVAVVVALLAFGNLCWHATIAVDTARDELTRTSNGLNTTIGKVNAAADEQKAYWKGAAKKAMDAADDYRRAGTRLSKVAYELGDSLNGNPERNIDGLIPAYTKLAKTMDTQLTKLGPMFESAKTALDSTNTLISDPKIKATVAHVESITDSGAEDMKKSMKTMDTMNRMADQVEGKLDATLHPSKKKLVGNAAWTLFKIFAIHWPL